MSPGSILLIGLGILLVFFLWLFKVSMCQQDANPVVLQSQQSQPSSQEEVESIRRRVVELCHAIVALEAAVVEDPDPDSRARIEHYRARIEQIRRVLIEMEGSNTFRRNNVQEQVGRLYRVKRIQDQLNIKVLENDNDADISSVLAQLQNDSTSQECDTSDSNTTEAPECSICLCDFQHGDTIAWARNTNDECHHIFHQECITEWLKSKDVCPMCRTNILRLDDLPNSSEEEEENNQDVETGTGNLPTTAP